LVKVLKFLKLVFRRLLLRLQRERRIFILRAGQLALVGLLVEVPPDQALVPVPVTPVVLIGRMVILLLDLGRAYLVFKNGVRVEKESKLIEADNILDLVFHFTMLKLLVAKLVDLQVPLVASRVQSQLD
jgi:hypothetical protein